jgi:hypothetical protein
MNEEIVRESAQAHAEATVAGDLKRAGSDLDRSAYGAAGKVMKQMPQDLTACEVTEVRAEGDEFVASIRYDGAGSVTVESRWAEREGRPVIVDLKTV